MNKDENVLDVRYLFVKDFGKYYSLLVCVGFFWQTAGQEMHEKKLRFVPKKEVLGF